MAGQKQIQKKFFAYCFHDPERKIDIILCYFAYAYVASEDQA